MKVKDENMTIRVADFIKIILLTINATMLFTWIFIMFLID